MTHNKYFFSGRLEAVRSTPTGGNLPQEFVPESVEGGPYEKDVLPLSTASDPFGAASYGLNPMLLEAIRMTDRFWDLPQYKKFSEVIDQIYYEVKYVTPWVPGTHGKKSTGMQSAVRGVSNAGTPGIAYTILYKLYIMKLTRPQIKSMLDHTDSPYIRCMGLLYLRIAMADGFKELWSWFEPYLNDKEEFTIDGTAQTKTTFGEYARRLLTDQDYFGDRLPRVPVLMMRQIEANLSGAKSGPSGPPVAELPSQVEERKRGRDDFVDERGDERDGERAHGEGSRAARREAELEGHRERIKKKRVEITSLEAKVRSLRKEIATKEEAEEQRRK